MSEKVRHMVFALNDDEKRIALEILKKAMISD